MGGLGSAAELTGWLAIHPADAAGQLAANAHPYNDGQASETPTCWSQDWGPIIAADLPVTVDELGEFDCAWGSWIQSLLSWQENNGSSGYVPWTWDPGAGCGHPGLLTQGTSYSNPISTTYGYGYMSNIAPLPRYGR